MKRYLVFAGDRFAAGGWRDYLCSSEDAQRAIREAEKSLMGDELKRWAHVVDTTVKEIVWMRGLSIGSDD
jgi:hypothetical protein